MKTQDLMMELWGLLAVIGGLIIIALAVVAGVLQFKVAKLKRATEARELASKKASDDQRERINKSIQVLAHSVGSDELTLTEASIRISVLLDSLSVEDSVREEFAAFYELKTATEHIPILSAWKSLSTREKLKFDRERTTQEQFHEQAVVDAAKRIRGRVF